MSRKKPLDPEDVRRVRGGRRYRRWRAGILRDEPLCRQCAAEGYTVAAEHLHHIEPVHLAPERFWERDNIEPICKAWT